MSNVFFINETLMGCHADAVGSVDKSHLQDLWFDRELLLKVSHVRTKFVSFMFSSFLSLFPNMQADG